MFNSSHLFKQRLKEHILLINRYLRYIFNGHFMIAVLFGIITLAIYYQKWLTNLSPTFPAAIVVAVVFGVTVFYNPIQTFLKEPDKVFLIVKEIKLGNYFWRALFYNFFVQMYVVILAIAVTTPLLMVAFPMKDKWDYIFLYGLLIILKGWNLLSQWWMLNIQHKMILYIDKILRIFMSIIFFYFFILESFLFVTIIFVFMLIMFNNNYMLARKKASLGWEKLIENDQHRLASFYRFVSQFANVPETYKRLKKRRALAKIIEKIVPFKHQATFDYIYRLTFIRSGDYLNLFIRLTVIGALIILFVPNRWFVLLLALLFLYLTAFQLASLYHHYRTSIWMKLYPIEMSERIQSFVNWLVQLTFIQTIIFALMLLIFEDIGTFFLMLAGGSLFNYLFHYGYIKRKISKSI